VLRASPVSSASFVSTFLWPCPSLARVATRRTCSAVLAIFSGGGRSTCLPPPAACGRASWVEKWQPAAQVLLVKSSLWFSVFSVAARPVSAVAGRLLRGAVLGRFAAKTAAASALAQV
jgi:hypothetical protein